jgi:Domain of unknown function (DUF6817)
MQLLRSRRADAIAHLDGDLLSHLVGTSVLLESWGCATDLALAGLCHACYGTEGFPRALLELSERSLLGDAIGADAEALVHLYASCDRRFLHPSLGRVHDPAFRDRFTGVIHVPTRAQISSLLELTFANELEIARRSRSILEAHRASLHELFSRCEGLVSDRAFECFLETWGPEGRACSP